MEISVGLRLVSQVDGTEAIVVSADTPDVELSCGGHPMVAKGSAVEPGLSPAAPDVAGTEVGKRYRHDELGVEVLVIRAGTGSLRIGAEPLLVNAPKRLPSSD